MERSNGASRQTPSSYEGALSRGEELSDKEMASLGADLARQKKTTPGQKRVTRIMAMATPILRKMRFGEGFYEKISADYLREQNLDYAIDVIGVTSASDKEALKNSGAIPDHSVIAFNPKQKERLEEMRAAYTLAVEFDKQGADHPLVRTLNEAGEYNGVDILLNSTPDQVFTDPDLPAHLQRLRERGDNLDALNALLDEYSENLPHDALDAVRSSLLDRTGAGVRAPTDDDRTWLEGVVQNCREIQTKADEVTNAFGPELGKLVTAYLMKKADKGRKPLAKADLVDFDRGLESLHLEAQRYAKKKDQFTQGLQDAIKTNVIRGRFEDETLIYLASYLQNLHYDKK